MNGIQKSTLWRGRLSTLAGSALLLTVVALVIAAIGWTKFRQVRSAMSAPPPPEMPVAVDWFRPQPAQFRSSTVVVGSALADRSVVVRNEEPGVVTKIGMKPGGQVNAGELLLQIDDRIERAALKAAAATLEQARASLERARKLQRANANSAQELDVSLADVQRAEAEVDRLNVLIDRKRITAEFDATVGLFDLHVGQYLEIGNDIATLEGRADHLYIDFAVPAHVADQIRLGDTVGMRVNATSPSLSAIMVAMDSRADPQSRSLRVRAKLGSPPKTLLPGDSVLVTVEYGPPIDVVLIPQTAVRRSPAGTSVFLAVEVAGDGVSETSLRAKSVPVTLAGSQGAMSRILDGVSPDDRVVADGSFKVLEGSLLAPTDAASPPRSGADPMQITDSEEHPVAAPKPENRQ